MFNLRRPSCSSNSASPSGPNGNQPIYVRTPDGSEYEIAPDGKAAGALKSAQSITITDTQFITEYTINRFHNTVSHVVRFVIGGTLCYSVDADGRILDCNFKNLEAQVSRGQLLVGCSDMVGRLKFDMPDDSNSTSDREQ
jgi:hypothetical protein